MPTVLVHFLLLSLLFLCLIHNANTTFYLNTKYITMHCNTVVAKIVRTPAKTPAVFSPAKTGFKSVICIFCCSVSVENISLHVQTFILPLLVIIQ